VGSKGGGGAKGRGKGEGSGPRGARDKRIRGKKTRRDKEELEIRGAGKGAKKNKDGTIGNWAFVFGFSVRGYGKDSSL